jgi:hypothetical protein
MTLGLQQYPDEERRAAEERRRYWPVSPGGGGRKREDWAKFLIPIVLAALVSYFTAQRSTAEQLATVRATEQNHFDEVLRRLALIQAWQDRQDSKRQ